MKIPISHSPTGWHDLRKVKLPEETDKIYWPSGVFAPRRFNEAVKSAILSAPLFRKEDEAKVRASVKFTVLCATDKDWYKWQQTDFQVYEIEVEGVETIECWVCDGMDDNGPTNEPCITCYGHGKLSRLVEGKEDGAMSYTEGMGIGKPDPSAESQLDLQRLNESHCLKVENHELHKRIAQLEAEIKEKDKEIERLKQEYSALLNSGHSESQEESFPTIAEGSEISGIGKFRIQVKGETEVWINGEKWIKESTIKP